MATAFPSPAGYSSAPPVETTYDQSQPGFVTPASFPGSQQIDRALAQGGGMPVEPTGADLRDSRQAFDGLTRAQQEYVASQLRAGRPAILSQPPTMRLPMGRDAVFQPVRAGSSVPQAGPPIYGQAALGYKLANAQSAGLAPPIEAQDVDGTPAQLMQFYNQQAALYGRQGAGMTVGDGQATFAVSGDQTARTMAASINQATGNQRAKQMVQWAMAAAKRGGY